MLDREAVADGACARITIPLLRERLLRRGQIKGALVLIDAIACNADTAQAIRNAGADCLLAVKAHQPGLMGETEAVFADPKAKVATTIDTEKGHGRVGVPLRCLCRLPPRAAVRHLVRRLRPCRTSARVNCRARCSRQGCRRRASAAGHDPLAQDDPQAGSDDHGNPGPCDCGAGAAGGAPDIPLTSMS